MSDAVRIIIPGPAGTVQDLGRTQALHLGVPVSGALDDYAHRVANWLVGNGATCATVESTSAVSVLVMDCTTTGALPPTITPPTLTPTDWRRGNGCEK